MAGASAAIAPSLPDATSSIAQAGLMHARGADGSAGDNLAGTCQCIEQTAIVFIALARDHCGGLFIGRTDQMAGDGFHQQRADGWLWLARAFQIADRPRKPDVHVLDVGDPFSKRPDVGCQLLVERIGHVPGDVDVQSLARSWPSSPISRATAATSGWRLLSIKTASNSATRRRFLRSEPVGQQIHDGIMIPHTRVMLPLQRSETDGRKSTTAADQENRRRFAGPKAIEDTVECPTSQSEGDNRVAQSICLPISANCGRRWLRRRRPACCVPPDQALIEVFVVAWHTLRECNRQLAEADLIVQSERGSVKNPLLSIRRMTVADLHVAGAALGMSPRIACEAGFLRRRTMLMIRWRSCSACKMIRPALGRTQSGIDLA